MLFSILKKEILLTLRDIHALFVLFAMPVAFILVMSLALQDTDESSQKKFDVAVIYLQADDEKHPAMALMTDSPVFRYTTFKDEDAVHAAKDKTNLLGMVIVPDDFFARLTDNAEKKSLPVQIKYASTTPLPLRKLLLANIRKGIAAYLLQQRLEGEMKNPLLRKGLQDKMMGDSLVNESEMTSGDKVKKRPSSVQQSVPAWLIFSMFFVVIPIATTFITEKQQGTMQRLLTLPIAHSYLLIGKLLPYLAINLIQTVLMFLVGIYIVPLVGGQGLVLSDNAWLLLPMSFAVGMMAICLALFIATIVRTTEQATTVGGVINLLLAAIGGIMVPVYVMPDFMQRTAAYSPMNWGLEGFLTILLRDGEFHDISRPFAGLLGMAFVFFMLAVINYRRGVKI